MKSHLIIVVVLFSFITSCGEDFFNEIPGEYAVPEKHYKTAIEVYTSYLGAFTSLQDVAPNLVIVNGLRADLVETTDNADSYLKAINNQQLSASNPYLDASGLYRVVISANEVLSNIDTSITDPDFTNLHYNKVFGNLVGLRSWAYFNIARLYNEVAYIPDNLTEIPEGQSFEYLSREEMFDTLIHHLDSLVLAADLFNVSTDVDIGQNRINNHALLGEIYLELDSFQLAANYLLKSTNSSETSHYKLNTDYKGKNWSNIFINSESKSSTVMTAVPFNLYERQENPLIRLVKQNHDYALAPTRFIMDVYDNQTNVELNVELGPGDIYRGRGVSFDALEDKPEILKYCQNEPENQFLDYGADIILYRAADIHTMLAEAYNRMGQGDAALQILNVGKRDLTNWSDNEGVRGRVLLAELSAGDGSVEYIENLIMTERAMELSFEGKRWFDLMRIARRRNDNSYLAIRVSNKYKDNEVRSRVRESLMDETNWYLPVIK